MEIISTTDLKSRLDRKEPLTIVEIQSTGSYGRGHLPGALNLPPDQFEARVAEVLPDHSATIVVYCSSPT